MFNLDFYNRLPHALNLVLIVAMLAVLLWRFRKENMSFGKGVFLFALRLIVFVMALVALQNPKVWDEDEVAQKRKQVIVLLDDSLSMKVKNGGESRWNAVNKGLKQIVNSPLNKKFLFPVVKLSNPRKTLVDDLGPDNLNDIDGWQPVATSTPLESVSLSQLQRFQQQNVVGMILLSDGRSTDDNENWDRIEGSKLKVHTLIPTGEDEYDSRVSSLISNDTCRQGDTIRLTAEIEHQGPAKTVEVALFQDGDLVEHRNVELDQKNMSLEFTVDMNRVGWHQMSVKLLSNDPVPQNNERSFMVNVLDDSLKVLLVSGFPHYDFRYLREALSRDKTVDLTVYLQSSDDAHPGWDTSLISFPRDLKDLLKYDVIVLQDMDVDDVEDHSWLALSRFVSEAQGALLIQAGYQNNFPASALGTPLEKLLPVFMRTGSVSSGKFTPLQTQDLFMNYVPEKVADWPSFYWAARVSAVPELTQVIWEHPDELTDDGHPLPLAAWAREGRGKVGYMGLANLWRFRAFGGDGSHYGIFSSYMRFLADSRYSGQSKLLKVKVGREGTVISGMEEKIQLEVRDATFNPYERKDVPAKLKTPSGTEKELTLPSIGDGRYQIATVFDEEGVHSLQFKVDDQWHEHRFVVHLSNREFDDIRLGRATLKEVASRTGGLSVDITEEGVNNLVNHLKQIPHEVKRDQARMLWNSTLYGVIMFLLLIVEWACRRLWSLP